MLDTPEVTESAELLTAYIPLIIPRDQIQVVMGPSIREVYEALVAQGIPPTGPWFTHHRRRPTDTFDFEVSVPVATPVTPAGRVQAGHLPAARVARTTYRGPYERLGTAWGELFAWVAAQGLTPRSDLWESYAVGPEAGPDPAGYQTVLNCPLVD